MSYSPKTQKQLQAAKKKDIETILSQKEMSLYQLEVCLSIDENVTKQFLETNQEVQDRIAARFEDVNGYFVQKRLSENKSLQSVLDVQKLFHESEERIKSQSSTEVFRIFTTPEDQIKDYVLSRKLDRILINYYDQTADLSDSGNTDLCYTYFNKDSRWNERLNSFLDEVGQYKAQPEIEALVEEKIGAIFAHATFDGAGRNFSYMSEAGMMVFEKKMMNTVLKKPSSLEAKFYIEHAENVLTQWWHNGGREGGVKKYTQAMQKLAEHFREEHPDMALMLLDKVKMHCSAEYLADFYEISGDKSVLAMLAENIQNFQKEEGIIDFKHKALAHYWGLVTGNNDLKKEGETPIANEVELGAVDLLTLSRDKQLLEEFKKSKISKIIIDTDCLQNKMNVKTLKEVVSGTPSLTELELEGVGTLDATALLGASKLQKLNIGNATLQEPEKLLGALTNLQVIVSYSSSYQKNKTKTDALYEALMQNKPQKLGRIDLPFSKEEENALMEKYPDLVVNYKEYSRSDLQRRNESIVKAKKSKKIEDIQSVIEEGGLIEYLKLIDPKDRPSFDDLNKATTKGWSSKSCFDTMRKEYGNRYFEVLSQVSNLCGFEELANEAKILKAVKEKKLVEYLRSLKAEKRPKFADFLKQIVSTEKGMTVIQEIQKAYPKNRYNDVLIEVLTLTNATDKDLKALENEPDFALIAKQYGEKKKYNQNMAATQSAFEKWKEEHQKGI